MLVKDEALAAVITFLESQQSAQQPSQHPSQYITSDLQAQGAQKEKKGKIKSLWNWLLKVVRKSDQGNWSYGVLVLVKAIWVDGCCME